MNNNKKVLYFFSISLFIILSVLIFKENKIVEITKEENKINKKQFSMYVKRTMNGDYEEYTESDMFPNSTNYTFNEERSYCEDNKDNIINEAINYEDGKVTITSGKTIYCYLYFDGNLYDIETDILVQNMNGSYRSVGETPEADSDYLVRYDCNNNESITSFGYDYTTHEYVLSSSSKNKCNIYFEEKIPDVKIMIYVNGEETSELSSEVSYTLDETLSACTNSEAVIEYDDSTKDVIVSTAKQTTCNIYLEGE